MKAIVYNEYGGPEVLKVMELPMPKPAANEVLIRVVSSGINRPDIFQRKGHYNAPDGAPKNILGLEVSGTVEARGKSVERWEVGDAVCALLGGGGYAGFVVVDERHCLPKPAGLSFAEAASLPETVLTVWHNVFQRGGLLQDESVLIHGGSGGIGITAIQLCNIFAKEVFTTAGTDEKCRKCVDLGASLAINYNEDDFEFVLSERKVNVILDSIGGPYFEKNLNVLLPDGRLIYINAIKGAKVQLDIGRIMRDRFTLSGSTLRSRSPEFKANLIHEVERVVWPEIERGRFKPVIDKRFSCDDIVAAHKLMERGAHFGKIVLDW